MAQTTSVDIQGMQAAQGSFQTAVDETTRTYTQMEGQISSLAASWTGDAASTYLGAMQEWLSEFQQVRAALGRMLETLGGNSNVYVTVHGNTQAQAAAVGKQIATPALPSFPI